MLRDTIKIYAEDGKEFSGTNIDNLFQERNDYESDLALKKEKEEVERKAKAKQDEELQKFKKEKLNEIKSLAAEFNNQVKMYEKKFGVKLVGNYNPLTEETYIAEMPNKLDYAWDNLIIDIFNRVLSDR